jgi:hypothetical protein
LKQNDKEKQRMIKKIQEVLNSGKWQRKTKNIQALKPIMEREV